MSIVNHRENELSLHKNKQLIGLNIDNFINSFNFEIVIMKEKIGLFLSYIEFFHSLHTKYLTRFSNKIQLMYSHIKRDIKFDDSVDMNNNSKEILDEFNFENMDSEISSSKTSKSEIGKNFMKLKTFLNKSEELDNIPENNSEYSSITNDSYNNQNIVLGPLDANINKEKKNFTKSIQKKMRKVTDMLQLCKNNKNIIEPKILSNKVEEKFYNFDVFNTSPNVTENIEVIVNEVKEQTELAETEIEKSIEVNEKEWLEPVIKDAVVVEDAVIKDAVVIKDVVVDEEAVDEEAVEDAVVDEEQFVEEAVVEEAVVEEAVVEEAVIKDAVVDEEQVEEAVVDEEQVEEAVVEEQSNMIDSTNTKKNKKKKKNKK
jgi:hypothetical protein